MSIPPEHETEFAAFPAVLRELVLAELAVGNAILKIAHGFPAAPCGASILLARGVSTRPRETATELDFYERNSSLYSSEFTDAKRHFFVLEPPRPPEPELDMDAIRAEREALYAAACEATNSAGYSSGEGIDFGRLSPEELAVRGRSLPDPKSVVARFAASMEIDYEKWHDGVGYDLGLLDEATVEERSAIEGILVGRQARDWRDVEALAALGSAKARAALLDAMNDGNAGVRMAVHRHAPELLTEQQRFDSLVAALETAEFYGGLSEALDEAAEFHPPEVEEALLRGLMTRDGAVAYHFAATLYFIHGRIASRHGMEKRTFFLRFNTADLVERETVVRELCVELCLDPHLAITPRPTP